MNVKKYRAADSDQAMRMIRLAHGADVAILDCYSVPGGVEVVVSLDEIPQPVAAPKSSQPSFAEQLSQLSTTVSGDATLAALQGRHKNGAPAVPGVHTGSTVKERPQQSSESAATPKLAWAQDEELLSMKREMAAMKAMLMEQLKGADRQQAEIQAPRQTALHRFMAAMDLDPALAQRLASEIPEQEDERLQRELLKALLIQKLPVQSPPSNGAIALIGPQGSGKTTSIAKLAAQHVMRHGRKDIAVLTADTARVGAQEQLRAFGKILQIPVHSAASAAEAQKIYRVLQNKSLVLIDTAGVSFRDRAGLRELEDLLDGMSDVTRYLTLPADKESYVQSEIIDAYSALSPQGLLITRIDETLRLGPVLSNLIQHRLPAVWCTNGPKVPQNLSAADAAKLVNLAVKMSLAFESKAATPKNAPQQQGSTVSAIG